MKIKGRIYAPEWLPHNWVIKTNGALYLIPICTDVTKQLDLSKCRTIKNHLLKEDEEVSEYYYDWMGVERG